MSGQHTGGHDDERDAYLTRRTRALEALLVEKGLVPPGLVDQLTARFEQVAGPHNGAKAVARAWVDPIYKQRLLEDGTAVISELGFTSTDLVVVENTPTRHNVIVCTLCSCYPLGFLGLPPAWYKSPAYRSRMVREPRAVLREFGLELDESVEIQVWDSSAELRYMVLPERPPGTEDWTEEELAALVTRDCLIGVAKVQAPKTER
jgi:nitrile hydratase subunit alpha